MVGSIIGVGVANQLLSPHMDGSGLDWSQAFRVLKVLLVSPFLGFAWPVCSSHLQKNRPLPSLFEAPKDSQPPPWPIRALMVITCTGVSFFHGSNDARRHGPHHAHPHRHRSHRLCAQPRREPDADPGLYLRLRSGRAHSRPLRRPWRHCRAGRARRSHGLHPHPADTADTVLALREMVAGLDREVTLYKEFKSVPANQQTNVRNDMSWPARLCG